MVGALCDPRLAPNPRRVHDPVWDAVQIDHGVDRIAGRPGPGRHQDPLGAGQAVEKRRLSDVGSPHDRQRRRAVLLQRRRPLGECGYEGVEQLACPPPVEGAHRIRLTDAEAPEVVDVGLPGGVIHLVGHEKHGCAGVLEEPGNPGIVGRDPGGGIDHEENRIGRPDRSLCLLPDRHHQILGRVDLPPAGVDQKKTVTRPLGGELAAVTGHTRHLLGHGGARTDDPVDQRRFPHIGATDHSYDGDRGHESHSQHSQRGLTRTRLARTRFGVRKRGHRTRGDAKTGWAPLFLPFW